MRARRIDGANLDKESAVWYFLVSQWMRSPAACSCRTGQSAASLVWPRHQAGKVGIGVACWGAGALCDKVRSSRVKGAAAFFVRKVWGENEAMRTSSPSVRRQCGRSLARIPSGCGVGCGRSSGHAHTDTRLHAGHAVCGAQQCRCSVQLYSLCTLAWSYIQPYMKSVLKEAPG